MPPLVVWNASDVINDIESIRRGFGQLPTALAKRHIRPAIRKAMEPYIPMFRAVAPRRTGGLKRSVTTVVDFQGTTGYFSGRVGYGRGRGKKGHHAILVADGTRTRHTKKGHNRGPMPSNAAMQSLADRIRASAPPMFETHLIAALENAIKALPIYTLKSRGRA